MDKRAAEQYLDRLFGTREGYVAVAYKDPSAPDKEAWQEHQFAWPSRKADVLNWAEIHQDANVFVCPALRRNGNARKKGDMQPSSWLWADVDWQTIPEDKKADVHDRIKELGTYIVSSGSGANAHVYVQLDRELSHEEFIKLNTGLRDYLYGDNKQADNSLLRLPGTTNWKTDVGTEVAERGGHGRKVTKPGLMKMRAFRDAKVPAEADAQDWDFVDTTDLGLPRRVQRMLEWDVATAKARNGGKRHKAVWAMSNELIKRGLGPDEVHSLMSQYPAALSKAAEENGYDVHRDVDRAFAAFRAIEELAPELNEQERDELSEAISDFEDADDGQDEMRQDILAEKRRIQIRSAAAHEARMEQAERDWREPPPNVSRLLTESLSMPREPEPFLIEGMAQARGNIVMTAQFKSGKTDLFMGSLARSLADGVDFLDHFPVHVPEGGMKVGHWNLEMDEAFLVDEYIRPSGFKNTDNLVIASLRGYRVSLLTEIGYRWTVNWLKDNGVRVWLIDSIAQLAQMAGVSENANEEMGRLLGAVNEVKTEAGVDACFLIAHTGRAQQEEGKERARAATIIDDWPDSRWVMTVDSSDIRYMQVQGRGTAMKATSLEYDTETHRYTMGGLTKTDAAGDGWVQSVVRVLKASHPTPLNERSLVTKLQELGKIGQQRARDVIKEADDSGFITIRTESTGRGGRPSKMHYLVDGPPENDPARNATPREVTIPKVRGRRRGN